MFTIVISFKSVSHYNSLLKRNKCIHSFIHSFIQYCGAITDKEKKTQNEMYRQSLVKKPNRKIFQIKRWTRVDIPFYFAIPIEQKLM